MNMIIGLFVGVLFVVVVVKPAIRVTCIRNLGVEPRTSVLLNPY